MSETALLANAHAPFYFKPFAPLFHPSPRLPFKESETMRDIIGKQEEIIAIKKQEVSNIAAQLEESRSTGVRFEAQMAAMANMTGPLRRSSAFLSVRLCLLG